MSLSLHELPILGVCGASGSGKTTLIEQTIHLLRGKGLKVVVAKQSPKLLAIDRPGKDSARFFAAGADLLMMGADGTFLRKQPVAGVDCGAELLTLASLYDVVLVEGYRHTPGPKIWLLAAEESRPPEDEQVLACLAWGMNRSQAMAAILDDFLGRQWLRPTVLGCILIGGKSTRMGRPKHLLVKDGQTWLQRTAGRLAEVSQQVVVAGEGDMGDCLLPRILDAPDSQGPLAGLLAVMRWQPWATVLVCACDLPEITVTALSWLLEQRVPGVRAVIPKVGDYHEPLLALYDFRIRPALEAMARQDIRKLSNLISEDGVRVVTPPVELCGAWRNVNYPEMV
jgi:molybdopterin-guanine dinucleotide biosynthesis protein MobB